MTELVPDPDDLATKIIPTLRRSQSGGEDRHKNISNNMV